MNKPINFRLKLKPIMIVLVVLALILGCSLIIVNCVNFFKDGATENLFSFLISIIIGVMSVLFCISCLVYSRIIIDDNYVIFKYGVLSNKFRIESVTKVSILEKSNKLILSYDTDNYFEASINPKFFSDFAKALTEKNPNVIVEYTNG